MPSLGWLTVGDSEDVKKIYSILTRFASFRRPGAYLVDVIPELANSWWFNLISPWKKVADEIFAYLPILCLLWTRFASRGKFGLLHPCPRGLYTFCPRG